MHTSQVRERQTPLRAQYQSQPESAMVVDRATTSGASANDPFHSTVEPMPGCGVKFPVGVHHAVGGKHDAPTPGDILCAALAACQDSTIRMVADLMGIELESLQVDVSGDVDVRGTLAVDKDVPVGFQNMRCDVQLKAKAGTSSAMLKRLQTAATRSCVVQQTLANPPQVKRMFKLT